MGESYMSGMLLTVFSTMLTVLVLSAAYCIKKLLHHDTELARIQATYDEQLVNLQAEIANVKSNCSRHQEWQTQQGDAIHTIHTAVVKIAAKMDIDI
jgi:anti-sigma-K factor RskA